MGLIIEKPSIYGVNATYFNIGAIRASYINKKVEAFVCGYISYEARTEGKKPITTKLYYFGDEIDFSNENLRAQIYQALKNNPDFEGAQDG